jgi:hypothetical protein
VGSQNEREKKEQTHDIVLDKHILPLALALTPALGQHLLLRVPRVRALGSGLLPPPVDQPIPIPIPIPDHPTTTTPPHRRDGRKGRPATTALLAGGADAGAPAPAHRGEGHARAPPAPGAVGLVLVRLADAAELRGAGGAAAVARGAVAARGDEDLEGRERADDDGCVRGRTVGG